MSDRDLITRELEQRIKAIDPRIQKLARNICSEIFKDPEPQSVTSGISDNLSEKLNVLKTNFDTAYSKLSEKMGL
jgi:hypothetical protein